MHRHFALVLLCKSCTRSAERIQNHLRTHALHAQLALLTALAFAALLAVHVRHIGLQDLLRRQNTLQVIADHKARPVRVRHEDDAAGRRQTAEIGQLLPVVEKGKKVQEKFMGTLFENTDEEGKENFIKTLNIISYNMDRVIKEERTDGV